MKPIFAKVLDTLHDEVFATRIIRRPFFSTEFHFHAECQILYIVKSSGKKIIGDCIENFDSDELTFLGSDIPHVWHNQDVSITADLDTAVHAQSIALFFHANKLAELLGRFFNVKKLERVLHLSKRGMKFHGKTKEDLKKLLFKISTSEGIDKFFFLIQILQILLKTHEYDLLASAGYTNTYQMKDNERIDTVFKFLFANFSKEIHLEKVAAIANMNKQAFCRFFKARTQKTVGQFITEIRIAHAKKLMSHDNASIGAIAYDCGYNSISNFNKFFKQITKKTPSEFRKEI